MDMFKYSNHRGQTLLTSTLYPSSTFVNKIVQLYQVGYLAETTTQRYKEPPQPRQEAIPVATIIH